MVASEVESIVMIETGYKFSNRTRWVYIIHEWG